MVCVLSDMSLAEWIFLGVCLSSPAHDMDFFCVCLWKEVESCTSPSFVLLPQEKKQCLCCRDHGDHHWGSCICWIPRVFAVFPLSLSYILCLMCSGLFPWSREEQYLLCGEFRRTSFPSRQGQQGPNIFSQLKGKKPHPYTPKIVGRI